MDITATYQLSQPEFRRALRNLPATRRMRIVCLALALVGALTLALDIGSGRDTVSGVLMLGAGGGITALVEGTVWLSAKRNAALLAGSWTVRLTDASFHLTTAVSQAEVSWDAYRKVSERAGFWYLHQLGRLVNLLPQRPFDEAQRAEITAFLAARLSAAERI